MVQSFFHIYFLRVRWRCSEYMRLSAILLSDSCMNFLSLSSKSMFPLVDAAGGAGVRTGFSRFGCASRLRGVLSGFCG